MVIVFFFPTWTAQVPAAGCFHLCFSALVVIPVYVCNIKRQHASLQPYFKILFVFALSCQCVRADLLPWCMHNLVWMKAAWRRRPLMHKRCVCVRACACLCVCLFKVWAGCSWCIILDDYYMGWIETTKPVKQGAFVVMMTEKNAPDSLFMQNVSHLQKKINFLEHINQRGMWQWCFVKFMINTAAQTLDRHIAFHHFLPALVPFLGRPHRFFTSSGLLYCLQQSRLCRTTTALI